jgi:asparagine synthase (glutamine-hydrolysing)
MNYRLSYALAEDMLVKVDRMSMATSLEVRAPMLDVDLAALSMQLPDHLLIKNGTTKYILREAVRRWLPGAVFSHPKTGFSIPMHVFQNRQYRELCWDLILDDSNGLMRHLFSRDGLERVVNLGLTRTYDAADMSVYRATHRLWSLLQLAAWIQYFKVGI